MAAAVPPCLAADAPVESLLGGDPALCGFLRAKGVAALRDLVFLPSWELRDWLLVPESEAEGVIGRACAACAAPLVSAWDLRARWAPAVPAPLPSLSAAVGGGLAGSFLEVAGPPGVGKTQLCLHLAALAALEGGEAFWLDTEHAFSPPRALELLRALCAGGPEAEGRALEALQRIRRRACSSLADVHAIASDLVQRTREGAGLPALVIVDSIAAVARNDGDVLAEEQRSWVPKRQAALSALAGLFKYLVAFRAAGSSQAPSCVVVTNQVSGDPERGGNKVALGHVWHHAVNWRVVLSHLPPGDERGLGAKENSAGGSRFLHLEKSPCAPPLSLQFLIGPAGLREVGSLG